ncbi:MAG: hypothetical protein IJU71_05935, partial [Selenomonadaceae bacterium]|nr:hypothetical protein [Selenomonadaceae bacterium]
MSKDVSIWNEATYGLLFKGREPDLDAPIRHISASSKLAVFELASRRGGVEQFLTEHGFNVVEVCSI